MDVVNDNNEIVRKETKSKIYGEKLSHRIVHIFVINLKTNDIYLQKRSDTVSFLPGYYCTSAGGHVKSGETYEEAAKRELKEEIGIDLPIHKLTPLNFISDNHKRFIELFAAFTEGGFNFGDGEVSGGEFMSFMEVEKLITKNDKIHPQLKVCFDWLKNNKDEIEKSSKA